MASSKDPAHIKKLLTQDTVRNDFVKAAVESYLSGKRLPLETMNQDLKDALDRGKYVTATAAATARDEETENRQQQQERERLISEQRKRLYAELYQKRERNMLHLNHTALKPEWMSDTDAFVGSDSSSSNSGPKPVRRTLEVGVIYPKISMQGYYEACGKNESNNKIRVCFPKLYFEYNGFLSNEQISWEITRLSMTRLSNVLVRHIVNPSPNIYAECLYVDACQTIEDLCDSSNEPKTSPETSTASHYVLLIDPKTYREFPRNWPHPMRCECTPTRFSSILMMNSCFAQGSFILDRPPKHRTLTKQRCFVLKPSPRATDPALPLEGYDTYFGRHNNRRYNMKLLYIELPLFLQCYQLSALDQQKRPITPELVHWTRTKNKI